MPLLTITPIGRLSLGVMLYVRFRVRDGDRDRDRDRGRDRDRDRDRGRLLFRNMHVWIRFIARDRVKVIDREGVGLVLGLGLGSLTKVSVRVQSFIK